VWRRWLYTAAGVKPTASRKPLPPISWTISPAVRCWSLVSRVVDLSVTPALEGRQPEYGADGWDMLEERLQGGTVLRLIRKWLKAGVLDTGGHVLNPVTGTPQGGVIPPPTIMQTVFLQKDTPLDPTDGIPSL